MTTPTASGLQGRIQDSLPSPFACLSIQEYIRLVWIIGGYLFLRPYLDLAFRKWFAMNEDTEPKIGTAIVELESDSATKSASKENGSTFAWGDGARKRQIAMMQAWEEEQEMKREEEDFEGIDPELLED